MSSIEFLTGMQQQRSKNAATRAEKERQKKELQFKLKEIKLEEERNQISKDAEARKLQEAVDKQNATVTEQQSAERMIKTMFGVPPGAGTGTQPVAPRRTNFPGTGASGQPTPQAFVPGPGQPVQSAPRAVAPVTQPTRAGFLGPGQKLSVKTGPLTASVTGQAPSDFTKNEMRRELADMGVRDPANATQTEIRLANERILKKKGKIEEIRGSAAERTKENIRLAKPTSGFMEDITGAKTVREREQLGIKGDLANSKSVTDLATSRQIVRKVTGTIQKLQTSLDADPASFFAPGAIASGITATLQGAKNMVRLTGLDPDVFLFDIELINILKEKGIANTQHQSDILGLALALATASGFQGREVTDRKMELFTRRLGAVSGNPEAFFEVLNDLMIEVNTEWAGNAEAVLKAKPGVIRHAVPERSIFGMSGKQRTVIKTVGGIARP